MFLCFFLRLFADAVPGPVQFPMPPADGPVESSGVIVGASGYGFVPPNGQSKLLKWTLQIGVKFLDAN